MASPPKIDIILYTSGTPDGQKASITPEELGIYYDVKNIESSKNVQKEGWFLQINPNGRIPAIVDKTPAPDGMDKRGKSASSNLVHSCYISAKDTTRETN